MAVICPTVLAATPEEYGEQYARIAPFANRIQIDLADGEFAPNRTVSPAQAWWDETVLADLHLMLRRPEEHLETLIAAHPHLVILHAEAEGDIAGLMRELGRHEILCGVALLADTDPLSCEELIALAQHVLIFSGDLGSFGGTANLVLLDKVAQVGAMHPGVEIGWDGGINDQNAAVLAGGGVDVLNVGGFIQRSLEPEQAYRSLVELLPA